MKRLIPILLLATALVSSAQQQQQPLLPRSLVTDPTQKRNDDALRESFRPVIAEARKSVVIIRSEGKDLVFGTIVSPDGYIVTKGSELKEKNICRMPDGKDLEARTVGYSEDHDLALLKVDAKGLSPVVWGDASKAKLGQWIASAGPNTLPVATGVVSVARRSIASRGAMLGVQLEDADHGAKVVQVVPDSGAARAGIMAGDIITAIAGTPTPSREELQNLLSQHRLGTTLKVTVVREGKEMEISATLGKRAATTQPSRSDMMNTMGGPLSTRNNGFPDVFQHDTVLKPSDCGTPLVDLDGKVLGINIARAGRTESYALPADLIVKVVAELKKDQVH